MLTKHHAIIALAIIGSAYPALAQQITSRTDLETILDDQIIIDDYESISLHSGGTFPLPNPTTAANSNDAIQQGYTITAETSVALFGGFLGGEEDVYLRITGDLTLDFDQPQIAIGMGIISATGYTITLHTRDGSVIEQLNTTSGGFFGYNASTQGITSITFTNPAATGISINNLTYGADFIPCPADINNDNVQDFFDISAFLTHFANEDDRADFTDDGQFDFFDISAFLTAFTIACP